MFLVFAIIASSLFNFQYTRHENLKRCESEKIKTSYCKELKKEIKRDLEAMASNPAVGE